jgi:hypothetical protein
MFNEAQRQAWQALPGLVHYPAQTPKSQSS